MEGVVSHGGVQVNRYTTTTVRHDGATLTHHTDDLDAVYDALDDARRYGARSFNATDEGAEMEHLTWTPEMDERAAEEAAADCCAKPDGELHPCVLTVDYQIRRAHPGNGESFSLAEMRALTGAQWIEMIPGPLPGTVAIVDEEGALRDRPYNETASVILRRTIVGDALICPAEMVQ